MYNAGAIEHGSSRSGRWLRSRRVRITLWIGAIEGLLYLLGILHFWEAAVIAITALAIWWWARHHQSDTVRQTTWIFASSQLIVLAIPIALAVVKALAIGIVALLAVAGLILLFTRRPS